MVGLKHIWILILLYPSFTTILCQQLDCHSEDSISKLWEVLSRNKMLVKYCFFPVSDHELQDYVLNLGPVDSLWSRPVKNRFQSIEVGLEFSLRQIQDVVSRTSYAHDFSVCLS